MASPEKQMIPLDAIPGENEDVPEELPSKEDLVDVKFPSRPRRKVVIIAGVIAVLVVIIVAASLIGKYVPEYLSDAEDKSEKGSKGKGTGGPEESILPSLTVRSSSHSPAETKPPAKTKIHQGQTWSLPEVKPSVKATSSDVIKQLGQTLSLPEVKPSVKGISSDATLQGQTSSLPKVTSLTSATSGVSDAPIVSSVSSTFSAASSIVDVAVIANLVPNTESKWTRWSSWSDCTKTCGTGSRQRTRTCIAINQRAVFAPISCAGKAKQVKSCAEWKCPDCSKNCTIGTLNAACDACTCDHHLLTGRILTVDDVPLSEANISFADSPYNILTQTNISGHFSSLGVCADGRQELLITMAGFVPVKKTANVLTPTTATITAKMEIAVAPFVTLHPKSKIRMSGQSVAFCCNGEGNPPPEIEWFKENNIIDKDLYNYNNVLEIPDVVGLNGSFRCRVVNQFGSEFSTTAQLTVLEKSVDSCSSIPSSKNETLPFGCTVNGTNVTTVDVGECKPVTCVKGNSSFNSSCTDPPLCCGPRSFESVLVQCGAFMSFNLSTVKTCECGKCIEKQTVLEGIVVGEDDSPAKFVDLFFAGTMVDRTGSNGMFSFAVPKSTKRAVVTFKDQIFKKYEEDDKIFTINEGQRAMYKVRLRQKAEPIIFNASEPLEVPLGDSSDSFADLELPENALLTEDGSIFSGNAKVTVSVTDPRNQSDILSAPGDFSSTSEDGEEQMLETFGMMKLNLEDDNGRPLTMSKPIKVYLDPEKLNITLPEGNASVVKLYWLDRKTGRWREVGDFFPEDGNKRRRKRSNKDRRVFLAGSVTPSIAKETLNFDNPKKVVGVRVTTSSGESDVIITAIRKDHKGYVERTTVDGVICMEIWKDMEYYLQAEKNFKYYDPDPSLKDSFGHVNGNIKDIEGDGNTISSFTFTSTLTYPRASPKGPIYYDDGASGAERAKCEKSVNSVDAEEGFVFKPPQPSSQEYSLLERDLASWISSKDAETCFIKVKITGTNVLFMAASYKKDDQEYTGKYGFHLRMSRAATSGSDNVVCLQFRCPADGDYTALLLTPMTSEATCTFTLTDKTLDDKQSDPDYCSPGSLPAVLGNEKWLCIPYDDSELFSTYKGSDEEGEARCLRSDQSYGGTDTTTEVLATKFSVEYNCRLPDDSYKKTVRTFNWTSDGDKCYVKIKVSGKRSVFKAESYSADKKTLFGYSTDITRPTLDDPEASATCLEYRCSDVLNNGSFSENTYIVIKPILGNCKFVDTGYDFDYYQSQCPYSLPAQQGENRSLCDVPLPSFLYPVPGLYNKPYYPWGQDAERTCRIGDEWLPSLRFPEMFSIGFALHYNCT